MLGVAVTALVAWVLTTMGGLNLLWGSLANGGLRHQPTKVTRFPTALTLGHLMLGVAGLVVWVFYLMTTHVAYAWTAFGSLVVVALLGFAMLTRWLVGRGGRHARTANREASMVAVAVHGGVAIMTFVLVFFTAVVVTHG